MKYNLGPYGPDPGNLNISASAEQGVYVVDYFTQIAPRSKIFKIDGRLLENSNNCHKRQ